MVVIDNEAVRQTQAAEANHHSDQPSGVHRYGSDHIHALLAHLDKQRTRGAHRLLGVHSPLPLSGDLVHAYFLGHRQSGQHQENHSSGRFAEIDEQQNIMKPKNIMISAHKRSSRFISILNVIQGEVDTSQVHATGARKETS